MQASPIKQKWLINELLQRLDQPTNVTFCLPPEDSSVAAALHYFRHEMDHAKNCKDEKNHMVAIKQLLNNITTSKDNSRVNCETNERKTYKDFKKTLQNVLQNINSSV
ncbi:hypothetical protein GN956_G10776 [Arapaima gigas]